MLRKHSTATGVIDGTTNGKMILPFEVIRPDFTLDTRKAA
jgi:hypothetical protein